MKYQLLLIVVTARELGTLMHCPPLRLRDVIGDTPRSWYPVSSSVKNGGMPLFFWAPLAQYFRAEPRLGSKHASAALCPLPRPLSGNTWPEG